MYNKNNLHFILPSHPISSSLTLWLSSLPQVLKELGHSSMETSSLIFEVLGHAAAKNMLPMVDYLAEHLFSKLEFSLRCVCVFTVINLILWCTNIVSTS